MGEHFLDLKLKENCVLNLKFFCDSTTCSLRKAGWLPSQGIDHFVENHFIVESHKVDQKLPMVSLGRKSPLKWINLSKITSSKVKILKDD
jgi:hypothetical protein